MRAYLFRIDDICHQTSKEKLQRLIYCFKQYNVRPILAVIPDNQDKSIHDEDEKEWIGEALWDMVKYLSSSLNWTVGVHGLHHLCVNRGTSLVPSGKMGEFVGLSGEEQLGMLKKSLSIFHQHNIEPTCWVAPRHVFDENTLWTLRRSVGPKIVSDGWWLYPHESGDLVFIPQQVATPRRYPIGIWTFCLHLQNMEEKDFKNTESFVYRNRECIVSLSDIANYKKNMVERLIEGLGFFILRAYRQLQQQAQPGDSRTASEA